VILLSGRKLIEHLDFAYGISTYRLGQEAGVSTGHLYRVRRGKKNLGLKAAIKIQEALLRLNAEAATWFAQQVFPGKM